MLIMIRYIGGEEQIGVVEQSEDGTVRYLTNPCIVETSIDGNGKVTANLYPAALFSKDRTVLLNEGSIMYTSVPSDEIAEAYNKRYNGSGIITPPKKELILG